MKNLFTSESVSEGHPDKLSDQISDSLLDNILAFDPDSKVAIETFVTTDRVIIGGETNTSSDIDYHRHQTLQHGERNRLCGIHRFHLQP